MRKTVSDVMETKEKDLRIGQMNVLKPPCGSGKTHWSLEFIFRNYNNEFIENYNRAVKVLYLIDTLAGRENIINRYEKLIDKYYVPEDDFLIPTVETVTNPYTDKEKRVIQSGACVETYANVSARLQKDYTFFDKFDIVIMDEAHMIFRFAKQYSKLIDFIPTLCKQRLVIVLTATPNKLYALRDEIPIKIIVSAADGLKAYKNIVEDYYVDIYQLLDADFLKDFQHIAIYTKKITKEKEYSDHLHSIGITNEYICSDSKCTPAQLSLKRFLIDEGKAPANYKAVIFNSTLETSVDLTGFDLVIIDDVLEETQIQVRGRFREDLPVVYYKTNNNEIIFDDCVINFLNRYYLNKPLFKEDKDQMFIELFKRDFHCKNKPIKSMKTLKNELEKIGYKIEFKNDKWYRTNENYKKNYTIITALE